MQRVAFTEGRKYMLNMDMQHTLKISGTKGQMGHITSLMRR